MLLWFEWEGNVFFYTSLPLWKWLLVFIFWQITFSIFNLKLPTFPTFCPMPNALYKRYNNINGTTGYNIFAYATSVPDPILLPSRFLYSGFDLFSCMLIQSCTVATNLKLHLYMLFANTSLTVWNCLSNNS